MIVSPEDLVGAFVRLALVGLLPGLPLSIALFPRLPLTQRIALAAAFSLAGPALVETVLGAFFGVPFTATLVWVVTLTLTALGVLLLVVRPAGAYRASLHPAPGTKPVVVLALVALMATGAYLTYHPHFAYDLPYHGDEWNTYDSAATIDRAQDVNADLTPGFGRAPELGFHVLLAHVHILSGADWIPLLDVWPTFVFLLTLLALFAGTAPFGYGLETALLALALPSTVRVLGPQYAVPVAFGLFLIPVTYMLFLSPNRRLGWAVLVFIVSFVYLAHPPTAAAVAFLLLSYSTITLRKNWKYALALVPLAVIPLALGFLEAPKRLADPDAVLSAESSLPVPTFLALFGILPLALFLIGAWYALHTRRPERLGWFGTSLAHLGIITAFLFLHVGVNILYDRAWMHGLLTMAVTAGSGLAFLRATMTERVRVLAQQRMAAAAAVAIAAMVILPAVVAGAAHEQESYRPVTEDEYHDYLWVRDHVRLAPGAKAVMLPYKGTPFEAVTGIPVISKAWSYSSPPWVIKFLYNNSKDGAFVKSTNVGFIYTDYPVNNSRFVSVHARMYLREDQPQAAFQ